MVHFVNVLVESAMVQQLMDKILPRVLEHQTTKHLEKKNIPAQRNILCYKLTIQFLYIVSVQIQVN